MPIDAIPDRALQLQSTLSPDGILRIELGEVPVAVPGDDEVVVRIEAAPINPSDLMAMFASGDPRKASFGGTPDRPVVTLQLPPEQARIHAAMVGKPATAGLEGAGQVVAAGRNVGHLLGKTVASLSMIQGMFAEYRTLPAAGCVQLPEDATATDGAALFVNPLTALAIAETVRLDGYAGLIHTAAASNLGQMLVRICRDDNIPLVNVVRREGQAELLRGLGATHVCNSSLPSFFDDLVRAIQETGAMVALDATGGEIMTDQLLKAMEVAAVSRLPAYSPYGSNERKQVHVYGHLDHSPIQLSYQGYGLIWGVSGWAMPIILERAGRERAAEIQQRVVRELKTTFASRYAREISLAEALDPENMAAYTRQATGEKYLIRPTR